MDIRKVTDLLRSTIDPNQRQQAESQLDQIHKIIGFAPALLQVIMMTDCDMPVRQAGAIYLKNLVLSNWQDREAENGQPVPFALHEQDRALIRDSIVDAVVHAPDLIRTQLCTCVHIMVKHDFPGRWTQIVDKISVYLSNPDPSGWHGALLSLYQLVKNFEYKKAEERAPLHEAMNLLLPQLYQLEIRLLPDSSEQSVLLQKEGLKIYFALTQYILPLDLISKETFAQWMEVCRQVIERAVPPAALQPDEDERPDLPWWKCKKWALHILYRMFERYGSPGHVSKEYNDFAEWYLQTFSTGILEVLLRVLDGYRGGHWVPPRVLQQTLNYLNQAVSHAHTWRILKPHMPAIIQDVLFPLMSYSAEDHELWTVDPHEYIRVKFDVFEDFVSPVTAAQTLLHSACKKRKEMLNKTMAMLTQVLTNPATEAPQKDGALHMVGSLADVFLKKKVYKEQLDQLFIKYVFPEFNSERGHMRARACWVLHYFAEFNFKQENVLIEAVNLTIRALLFDKDLPVKVEAAIALQSLLNYQERSHKYIETQVKQIALELLTIIRETENEDVTGVMQKLVCVFTQQLAPIAVEICQHLTSTFTQVLDTDEGSDEKAITAMGLLNTVETLLTVMDEQPEVMRMLEPTVLQVIAQVLQNEVQDFYEEILSLIYDLTSKQISPDMWKVFELVYQVFMKNGIDHFTDMMPALHNYITVDTAAFLSDEKRLLAIYNMCKEVLTKDNGEDPEAHAAKLLEVVLLQCRGKIDQAAPQLVELAATRLLREVKTSELRTMCLQVLIAALYYDPQLLFGVLQKMPDFTNHFIKQWLHDTDCFLGIHDRKLCVLGLCTLIGLGQKPPVLIEMAPKIVPSLILLFDGLKRAYAAKAQAEAEEEESDSEDADLGEDVLSSDEDELDDEGQDYLETLGKKALAAGEAAGMQVTATINDLEDGSDDEDSDYEPNEETVLETYGTPIDEEDCDVDEYLAFKQVMTSIQTREPEWYAALTANLTEQQLKTLNEVVVLAEQRAAARESKRIEQQGGYMFTQQAVPTSFKFGDGKS
ncbi:importin-7 [Anthonomus grandis grandis]|uniref:importin-7 n=1 Tax=Anthonomus grandis grandis TaxID=2921223 RepID=UPI00216557D2|nr:importin-7 [Anthonomus grandis grandis]XP_050295460.1 importin-7 [Anthonomus grandis grandis]